MSLEDETGVVQVISWRKVKEKQRTELLESRLLAVFGLWQTDGQVHSLIADHLMDLTPMQERLATQSRDFH